jgi:hypothetical protein
LLPRGSEGEGASAEVAEGETNFYRVNFEVQHLKPFSSLGFRNMTVTLDAYIDEKKSDAAYASSFIPGSEKRISMTDEQALFGADLGKVARGEIEVVDDRQRPLR